MNLSGGAIVLCAIPTTPTFMCAVVVLASEWWRNVERFLNQRLKLTLNRGKSRVARPRVCDYLGYGMSYMNQALPKKLWGRSRAGLNTRSAFFVLAPNSIDWLFSEWQ